MGKSPAKWYTAFATSFGPMGAVAGVNGLTRIILPGYSKADLLAKLAWDFPKAAKDEKPFTNFMEQAQAYFAGREAHFPIEWLDIPGEGAFAGKVYRACWKIPYGQTQSYRELALAAGNPDAARAAATMMSKNNLPLAIPCHRVVYADGRLGGFSAEGGWDLKRRMLKLEGASLC